MMHKPLKIYTMSIVLLLHICIGYCVMNMQSSKLIERKIKASPIQITMLTLPIKKKPIPEPTIVKPKPQKVKPKPKTVKPKPQKVKPKIVKPKPKSKPKRVKPKPKVVPIQPELVKPEIVELPSQPIEPKIVEPQPIEPKPIEPKPVEVKPESVKPKPVPKPKVVTASQAQWIITPQLIIPRAVKRELANNNVSSYKIRIKMSVNKQGDVTTASIISGSGDTRIDKAAIKAAKKAKIKPFTDNGIPVAGVITYNLLHKIDR